MCVCLALYGSIPYVYTVQSEAGIGFVGGFDFLQYPSPVCVPLFTDVVPIVDRDV